jgi:hypothetical protein
MELAAHQPGPGERMGPRPVDAPPGERHPTVATGAGGAGGRDLDQAIGVLRARIDEEFQITERFATKGRHAFALAAAFFAVVQTVAFGSFQEGGVQPGERVALLVVALIAGAALVVVAHRVTGGEELLEEADIRPEAIVDWCEEAGDDPEYVPARLVSELSRMARRRSENNAIRGRNYDAVEQAVRLALIATAFELVVAIVVRI